MVSIKAILFLWICFILLGCGSTSTTPSEPLVDIQTIDDQTNLVPTVEYIPKQKVNKKGELIPYESQENPYLKRQSAIKKVHIALYLAAKRAFDKNNLDESKSLLDDLVAQTDRLSGPWVMLGDIAVEKNQLSVANEHLIKAIKINKNNVNAYLRLAKVQRLQGQFLQAQHTYASVLSIWRDFPEAHLNLGVLYDVYLNDPRKARDHMLAYQFLSQEKNQQVDLWIKEIEQRSDLTTNNENALAHIHQEPTPDE